MKRNWLVFKKWHKDFGEFWPNTPKSQKLDFNGLLLIKVYSFWGKKVNRRSLYWIVILKVDASFEGKKSVVSLMTWGIWWTLSEHWKILKFALWETFFSQDIKWWAKKFQMSYVSWHWRVMQCLTKNWLVVWKMT